MLHVFGCAALAVLVGYLVLFFAGGGMAARAAGVMSGCLARRGGGIGWRRWGSVWPSRWRC